MQKGQAAIEFMFIILIVIIYLSTVVIPLTNDSKNAINDVDSISRANNETQKIVNAIQRVSSFGEGTKETVVLIVPQKTNIICLDKNISFRVELTSTPYPAQCPTGNCTKTFLLPQNQTMDCRNPIVIGPVKTKIVIEKSAGNQIIFTQIH